MNFLLAILINIVILLVFISWLIPTIYHLGNKESKFRILIIGGTHGNEPAGYYGIEEVYNEIKYRDDLPFELIMIPNVNKLGLLLNIRTFFTKDLNREYGLENGTYSIINNLIEPLARNSDLILDLHEGWSYNKITPDSMGSTISGKNIPTKLINDMLRNLNMDITRAEKKFYYTEFEPIEGTLDEIMENNQTYILVETTGQNDIQPINIRINQMKSVIYSVLNYAKTNLKKS